jgi:mono/diheme cytochrome c family protein
MLKEVLMFAKGIDNKCPITIGLLTCLVFLFTAAIAFAGGTGHTHDEEDTHGMEIPGEYRHLKNPYWTDLEAIIAGSKIYKEKCASCHGLKGDGKGPHAESLSKKPFSFTDSAHMSRMTDGYLFWRTVKGGKHPPFNSDMPAFENILTETEVWQVLSYVHAISHRHLLNHVPGEDITMVMKSDHDNKHEQEYHAH